MSILDGLFPKHNWKYDKKQDLRVCTTCGRAEELYCDSSEARLAWVPIKRGSRSAHKAKSAAQIQHVFMDGEYAATQEQAN